MKWVKRVVGVVAMYYGQGGIGSNLLGQAVGGGTESSGNSNDSLGSGISSIIGAIKSSKNTTGGGK